MNRSNCGGFVKVVVIISAIVAVVATYAVYQSVIQTERVFPTDSSSGTEQENPEKTELIKTTVQETKAALNLPLQFDEVTVLNDITPEPNAVRYHYTLVGEIDADVFSDDLIKDSIGNTLCSSPDTKDILDQGIDIEYSYTAENSGENYFIPFTQADCLNYTTTDTGATGTIQYDIGDGPEKVEFIETTVQEAKAGLNMPVQVDETTVLADITAETNAIRFHYTLAGDVNADDFSDDMVRSRLGPSLCSAPSTRGILDNEINMEYSYTAESSGDNYLISFTQADCL